MHRSQAAAYLASACLLMAACGEDATSRAGATPSDSAVRRGMRDTVVTWLDGIPITGTPVRGFERFDSVVVAFMNAHSIRAGALAISRDGLLRYARGFGWRDSAGTAFLRPDAPFRLASLSKPLTAAAIRVLIREGAVAMSTPVFRYLDLAPAGRVADARIFDVTIAHLLDHRGGWDRATDRDPVFASRDVARQLGQLSPASKAELARWMMTRPLQFTPGTRRAYSNFGYLLLGMVVEKASGLPYLDVVRDDVLPEIGDEEVFLGRSLPADRDPREPRYAYPRFQCSVFFIQTCRQVPAADGGFYLESLDAAAGIVASAPVMVRFLDVYWLSGEPRASGESREGFRFGLLPGTFTLASQRLDGVNFVALFNQRPEAAPDRNRLRVQLDDAAVQVWR